MCVQDLKLSVDPFLRWGERGICRRSPFPSRPRYLSTTSFSVLVLPSAYRFHQLVLISLDVTHACENWRYVTHAALIEAREPGSWWKWSKQAEFRNRAVFAQSFYISTVTVSPFPSPSPSPPPPCAAHGFIMVDWNSKDEIQKDGRAYITGDE